MDSAPGNLSRRRQEQRNVQNLSPPTEEELKAARECLVKNFWYRCVPFTVISVVATKALLAKGIITSSSRFGARSKLLFGGIFGYIAGNISSMKACREQLMKVRSYPLDEQGHQGDRRQTQFPSDAPSSYPSQSLTPLSESPKIPKYSPSEYDTSAATVPFSSSMSESLPTGIVYNTGRDAEPVPEERSKQKIMTYDELRSSNRDPYHTAGLPTQKTPQRAPAEDKGTWKKDKKNKYGDVWEE
ncbi:OCIA domain-containing protein 1-like [Pseudophryne corroboree]|uniref:OCIA domain-containing protein 1-like n=1 Tax=Pseudophryne corroboree TaxID=495146 RepID=UPI0030819283